MSVRWEYRQSVCDVGQLAELCNRFAVHGWDVVAVVEAHRHVALPAIVGDDLGPRAVYAALRPYTVLFRRPSKPEEEE